VRTAISISAKVPVLKAVGMSNVSEGGVWEDKAAIKNIGTLTRYWARAEVDEFMYGIDGRVMEECSKRKVRYPYRLWGCGLCVNCGGFTVAHAAVASAAAAVSMLAKVFWRSLLMCQVG
jgi:hypothetical protein